MLESHSEGNLASSFDCLSPTRACGRGRGRSIGAPDSDRIGHGAISELDLESFQETCLLIVVLKADPNHTAVAERRT